MQPTEVLIVIALAAYRATRILTVDTITEPFREKLHAWAWDDDHPTTVDGKQYATPRAAWRTWVDGLLTCPLCLGVWVAAALDVAWRWSGSSAVHSGIVILAIAGAQCFLASRRDA